MKTLSWVNVEEYEDCFISYLLFQEGKTIELIGKIRNKNKAVVEKDIIKSKAYLHQKRQKEDDRLLNIISMDKSRRIEKLESLSGDDKGFLIEEIYNRYTSFKDSEDRVILIWLIGELDSDKLLPFLKMELNSKIFNQKRLACSALGKLKRSETRYWLYPFIDDENPQVRQYAVRALKDIGDLETIDIFRNRFRIEKKDYVKRAILESVETINEKYK